MDDQKNKIRKVSQRNPEIPVERRIHSEQEYELALRRRDRFLRLYGFKAVRTPFIPPGRRYIYFDKIRYESLEGFPEVRGYDFDQSFDFMSFIESYESTGLQATELARAIRILQKARDEGAAIAFGFTSNMGTSGIREQLAWLHKHQLIDCSSTTAGAVEEDLAKCFKPFVLGAWRAEGAKLLKDYINRTGNIFIPMDRYSKLKEFLFSLFVRLYRHQVEHNEVFGVTEFVYELGHELEIQQVPGRERSFVYWAWRNNIPIYCPAILDGAIGDVAYYFLKAHPDFVLDASDYFVQSADRMLRHRSAKRKVAAFLIGGSVPKHLLTNAAIPIGGVDYAVYVNTGLEMEGSNAGAPVDEAVSWGKIAPKAEQVKVETEASLVVPLIIAAAFKLYTPCAAARKSDGAWDNPRRRERSRDAQLERQVDTEDDEGVVP
ncbi:hypothetical protein CKO15_08085 [Halorhodospira abdelmalekii]|uniref:deoxyhypusine synthase family protein n=1 Tax=Halorhodospira abdelmalekii TaxID=421629 RepID=UPI0019045284|nr:deoxyhypusine synthase family protein [Halorhodospira abdelmalekii]MBK1735244.1 hypothetical protein [Halorhodospira abdelmalekii]